MNLELKKTDFQMGLISPCTTLYRDPIGGRGIPDRYPHTVSWLPFKVLKAIYMVLYLNYFSGQN
jgi:hypothetical protein